MVTEGLATEIAQVAAEKQALAEDRVKFQHKMKESARSLTASWFLNLQKKLANCAKTVKHNEGLAKLENFVVVHWHVKSRVCAKDKRDVVETKVRLVREARGTT
jgi:hypothetical protein